ncbi:MAG: hypothetical protein V2I97_13515, partial [Desulfococcaceae bacterium]|nr:hypothetical protein [Desulfococcaceae bacterium]
ECSMSSIYTFENYRKWAFAIHSSFKFTAFVFSAEKPPENHSFPAAFMLRDTQVLEGGLPERVVKLSYEYVKMLSPSTFALIDNKSDSEARFILKAHKNFPLFGSEESDWNPVYRRQLDMGNDSWRFKTREWMKERGFTQVLPRKQEDGTWTQEKSGPESAALPESLPDGGEYWISADADYYRQRGYSEDQVEISGKKLTFFIAPEDADLEKSKKFDLKKDFRRIFPSEIYTALYEGRMVHIFDHSQKRYLHGEGRKAIWEDIPVADKMLQPRVFLCKAETGKETKPRIGFCDVTGATNERSILATIIGKDNFSGDTVPNLSTENGKKNLVLLSILCSFFCDTLIRLRISTRLKWYLLKNLAIPRYSSIPAQKREEICHLAAKLNCTTPELAEVWNAVFPDEPWTYASAERDLWKRAEIRAKLDAIVAELYGLSVEEYAVILTGFPLMDRDQPPLPGDYFMTEGNETSKNKGEEGKDWIEKEWGIFELKARSFITRDFALLTYMEHKKYPIPRKLDEWYREKADFDPEGSLSRFRIGEIKDLKDRVETARKKGAVPYIPTTRGETRNEDQADSGDSE